MMKKTLIVLFIIIILILVGFLFYREELFSKEILKIDILGPTSAKIGDVIEYTVLYKNNGNFDLQNVKLIFELPDNSLTEDGKTIFTQKLNDIYPGDQEMVKFRARLFGKDGDLKTAKAALTYVPKNITANYESDTSFVTKIDASSLFLNLIVPVQAQQDSVFQYSVDYSSNVNYPLENLSIKVDPVPGFNITTADPKSLDNTEWKLPTLTNGQSGKIFLTGNIAAADNQQNLTFSASLGLWQNGDFIVIKQTSATVQVVPPQIPPTISSPPQDQTLLPQD